LGEHGDDDDDAEGTISDQAGGRHADSGGLVRDHSVLPGGGEQEALAWRTEELRQELMDRVRAMSSDELHALKVKMT
jgi:hypothetical protein